MPTLETARFRFRPEIDEQDREAALNASSRLLAEQPDYRRRLVARQSDGEWLDLVEWESRITCLELLEERFEPEPGKTLEDFLRRLPAEG